METLNNLLYKNGINSEELAMLIEARERGEVDFLLIDVREEFEYSLSHIKGVDMLKPTSSFQTWANELIESYKGETIIFTCRTDNRSGQVVDILKEYGIDAINHLGGIVSYKGEVT